MGVPGLFRWLCSQSSVVHLKRYSPSASITNDFSADVLALDANSLIHQAVHLALERVDNSKTLETTIFEWLGLLIDSIVVRVGPKRTLIVAVDGVCPLAKLMQQRQRRYKARLLPRKPSRSNNGSELSAEMFDSNCITPGTDFMCRLDSYLERFLTTKYRETLTVIYSSHLVPGEGEHKILDIVRARFMRNTIVVHGVDGDLILLCGLLQQQMTDALSSSSSSSSSRRHGFRDRAASATVFLMREENTFPIGTVTKSGSQDATVVVSCDSFCRAILRHWRFPDVESFVALLCLCGNDFLPAVPGFENLSAAINLAIEVYQSSDAWRQFVDSTKRLDRACFEQFLCALAEHESRLLTGLGSISFVEAHIPYSLSKRETIHVGTFRNAHYQIERLCQNVSSPGSFRNPSAAAAFDIPVDVRHDIESGCDGKEVPESFPSDMVASYVNGIEWTVRYYSLGSTAVSVRWNYEYWSAPMLCDLTQCGRTQMHRDVHLHSANAFYHPLQQLLAVLPPQSFKELPQLVRESLLRRFSVSDGPNGAETLTSGLALQRELYPTLVLLRQKGLKKGHEQLVMRPPMLDRILSLLSSMSWNSHDLTLLERRHTLVVPCFRSTANVVPEQDPN